MNRLENKVVIVTGAAKGIGAETSFELAVNEGATVIIADVNMQAAKTKAEEIKASGGKAFPIQLDVSNGEQVKKVFAEIAKAHGQINVLVNNAGITRDNYILKMSEEDWDNVIKVNLKGPFLCIQAAVPHMPKNNGSSVVNIASIVGKFGNPGQTNYAAAKGGLIAMTLSLAKELAHFGIRVNAVAPGFIETDMTKDLNPKIIEAVKEKTPLKRMGKPEDVASAIIWLIKEEFATGDILDVNGGLVLS